MADRRTQSIIEQAEGRKLADEAIREVALGHSTFEDELARLKSARQSCSKKGDVKLCRHWTIAERLVKKAQKDEKAKTISDPPTEESAAL